MSQWKSRIDSNQLQIAIAQKFRRELFACLFPLISIDIQRIKHASLGVKAFYCMLVCSSITTSTSRLLESIVSSPPLAEISIENCGQTFQIASIAFSCLPLAPSLLPDPNHGLPTRNSRVATASFLNIILDIGSSSSSFAIEFRLMGRI